MPNHIDHIDYVDIAICGAGPVGLALVVMLLEHQIPAARIALIDARNTEQSQHDPRSLALSWGSRQLLMQLDAWQHNAVTPIQEVHVSRHGHFGRTLIDCTQYHLPALGYVLRYGTLIAALEERIKNSGIQLIRPATVMDIQDTEKGAHIHIKDHPPLFAHLVVQAEGGLFSEQKKKALHRDYRQTAVIAHVKSTYPVPNRAFERFCDEGPLALLPQDDGYALVWCVRPDTACALMALEDRAFLDTLAHAFGHRLGRFVALSGRNTFALGLNARTNDKKHIVTIGNAAQTLHPVAGQGFNLGLRDAHVLAKLWVQHTHATKVAACFAAKRKHDRDTTICLTDTMARFFTRPAAFPLQQSALALLLGVMDNLPPARHFLARHMMFGQRS